MGATWPSYPGAQHTWVAWPSADRIDVAKRRADAPPEFGCRSRFGHGIITPAGLLVSNTVHRQTHTKGCHRTVAVRCAVLGEVVLGRSCKGAQLLRPLPPREARKAVLGEYRGQCVPSPVWWGPCTSCATRPQALFTARPSWTISFTFTPLVSALIRLDFSNRFRN